MTSTPCPTCGHTLTKGEDNRLRCKTCGYFERDEEEKPHWPFGDEDWTPESEALAWAVPTITAAEQGEAA